MYAYTLSDCKKQSDIKQESQGVYNFSNIRYAAPPIGDLRFRAPIPPEQNRTTVQKGDVGRICPQADPLWETSITPNFVMDYLDNKKFNGSSDISSYQYKPTKQDPRATEDCLFLDVVVPQKIFLKANHKKPKLAPVLVWIYGGGYTMGEKSSSDASGLIKRSFDDDREGIVYVALNYRVSLTEKFARGLLTIVVGCLWLASWVLSYRKRHCKCCPPRSTTRS